MIKKNILFAVFLFASILFVGAVKLQAQDVSGKWYGVATPDVAEPANSFLCELIIEKKAKNKIEGYLNYYFRNGYFTNKITGSYNPKTRELSINTIPILYYKTTKLEIGIDCNMLGSFLLKASRIESSFTGYFYSKEYAYTCPPLNISFVKSETESQLEKLESHFATNDTVQPKNTVPTLSPELKKLNYRRKEVIRILDVVEDSVLIQLYDNGEFDHDSISVYHNGKAIVKNELLEVRKPISFKIYVDSIEANNELILFAENLGSIPPNAALMIVTDKHNRYEIHLESDYIKNAAIRLRKRRK